MAILMGYVYAKFSKIDGSAIVDWAKDKIKSFKQHEIDVYDIDRYWLVFYQLYFDGAIPKPPYNDQADNEIFVLLKKENVSFIDFEHPDFTSPFKKLFKIEPTS